MLVPWPVPVRKSTATADRHDRRVHRLSGSKVSQSEVVVVLLNACHQVVSSLETRKPYHSVLSLAERTVAHRTPLADTTDGRFLDQARVSRFYLLLLRFPFLLLSFFLFLYRLPSPHLQPFHVIYILYIIVLVICLFFLFTILLLRHNRHAPLIIDESLLMYYRYVHLYTTFNISPARSNRSSRPYFLLFLL